MLINFDDISDDSRLWLYASDIKLTGQQEAYILEHISKHLENWEAHKASLRAAVTILEGYFIIVALDESKTLASGCSIDTLQKVIQDLEKVLSISLLNRLNIFCKINDDIVCVPSSELSKRVSSETLFYDLTINKKSDLSFFLKPISNGWCNYLLLQS